MPERGRKNKPLVQLNSSISIKSNKKAMNTEEDNSQTRREKIEDSIRKNLLSKMNKN